MSQKDDINESSEPEIYLDMDGVLVDFFNEWAKLVGVKNWRDIKDPEKSFELIKKQKDWWENLPTLPSAKAILSKIKEVKGQYKILSSPLANDPNSVPGKKQWIKKNLSQFSPADIILTHDKPKYAKKQDGTPNVLIDDFGKNIKGWENAGGIGIKHENSSPALTLQKLDSIFKNKDNNDLNEDSPVAKLKRLYSVTRHEPQYIKASETLVKVLKRKKQENDGKLKHTIGYYAQQVGKTFRNVDYRALMNYFEKHGYDKQIVKDSVYESFDNPYKLNPSQYSPGADQWSTTAKTPTHTISFTADAIYEETGPGAAWEFEFGTIRGSTPKFDVTGEGDAQRVFATALAALKMFIQDVQPGTIRFTADKGKYGSSRTKLYQRMVQKYASQFGFKPYVDKDEDDADEFSLFKEAWSNKYKKSIDCSNPKGFSQKAHCAGKKKK